jgi:asparagine synthase (glutamine-hydrolysing)
MLGFFEKWGATMSVQFGRWNLSGKPVNREYLQKVEPLLAPYGPDGLGSYSKGNVSIIYCSFYTTKEARGETQPYVAPSGCVLTWDGRLDNRIELIRRLANKVNEASSDLAIVAEAYERWEKDCFARLIGDWTLSIWDPGKRSLILAKDPIGVRHLYYSLDNNQLTWSSVLEPLVLLSERSLELCEEYIAGWFSYFPATHLTPYLGLHSVPPSCWIQIQQGGATVHRYWDFDPDKRIRYRTDSEYEEHFRAVFSKAVRRRLRSDTPILAELSGGMDSSAIVCVADTIIAECQTDIPRLDTISYFDDSEPNWNERPYFTKVEEKRGRVGCHIDVSNPEAFNFELDREHFAAIPSSGTKHSRALKEFTDYITSQRHRVVLSGIGGDEVMGGVPTPMLELEDLLASGQFGKLVHQLKAWALNKRTPWHRLLFMTIRRFLPAMTFSVNKSEGPTAWLNGDFIRRNGSALGAGRNRVNFFGPLPSFQGNIATLIGLQRQLSCDILQSDPLYEKRYPYLDLTLLEFIYAIPREQLVRPGRRRSLMRRALHELVPTEILERKRKAYVSKSPVVALQKVADRIETLLECALTVHYGFVDADKLRSSVDRIMSGKDVKEWAFLTRTLGLELWLRARDENLTSINFAGSRQQPVSTFNRMGKIRTNQAVS